MITPTFKQLLNLLGVSCLALSGATAGDTATTDSKQILLDHPSPPTESPWKFELSPYFWFANLKGTVGVDGTSSDIDLGVDDIFDNLDFAFATTAGVRYERFGLFADFLYLKITPSFETPGPNNGRADLSLEQTVLDLRGSYRVFESDKGWLEILAGARYMSVDLGLTLQPGLAPGSSGSGRETWWDAVGGLRGHYDISDRVFLTAMTDIGGGSSDLTWQMQGGIGYRINDLIHFTGGYRYIDYDYTNGGFKYEVNTRGVYLELGFTW